jgi:hypothetical protein
MMFGQITNYALLREIAFRPGTDLRVFSNAVIQAVITAGPDRLFRDLAVTLKQRPKLEKRDNIELLKKQSEVRHIVVDSLYISFSEMPRDNARKVLDQISVELREGKPWHDVYWKYMEKYEHPYEQKLSNGTLIKGNRSYIGNLGDFVLPANGNPLLSYREEWMPKKHAEKLFTAKVGEILILFDKEDLSRFGVIPDEKDTGERYVLHRVREVYSGK